MPLPVIPFVVVAVAGGVASLLLRRRGPSVEHVNFLRSMQAGMLLDRLRSGATTSIAAAASGEIVRVEGVSEPSAEPLGAPLSGRACVAWELSLWEPLGGMAWRCTDHWRSATPFVVRDATGQASVDVERVRSYAIVDREEPFHRWVDAPDVIRRRMARAGVEIGPSGPLRLKESVLAGGEPVVVVGLARRSEGHYRDAAEAMIRLVAPPGGELLLSDAPEAVAEVEPG